MRIKVAAALDHVRRICGGAPACAQDLGPQIQEVRRRHLRLCRKELQIQYRHYSHAGRGGADRQRA